jgi:hypothetical protein
VTKTAFLLKRKQKVYAGNATALVTKIRIKFQERKFARADNKRLATTKDNSQDGTTNSAKGLCRLQQSTL